MSLNAFKYKSMVTIFYYGNLIFFQSVIILLFKVNETCYFICINGYILTYSFLIIDNDILKTIIAIV